MGQPTNLGLDLDQTITAAVNARVEAEMMKALSGDETIGAFITAALRQTVEVPKPGSSYDKIKVPYLHVVLQKAVQAAAKRAVEKFIEEEVALIENEVRKALRRDVKKIAETMSQSLIDGAGKAYGVSVAVELKMPSGY